MESYYSLVKFVNNPNSNENIVVGLLVLSNKKLFYNISQSKLKFAKRLNFNAWQLFNYALDKFNFHLQDENEIINNGQLSIFDTNISKDFLERLSIYQNGYFQLSKPELILKSFDTSAFNLYFRKFVGEELFQPNEALGRKDLKKRLETFYKKDVFSKVDIHYKINPDVIPGLFFPTEVDFIGKNGQLLVGQSLDFNLTPSTISKNFNEFENLVYNLEKFSKFNKIARGNYKLIFGKPKPNTEQEKIFNKIYRKKNEAPFDFIQPEELEGISKTLEETHFIKFSDFINSSLINVT